MLTACSKGAPFLGGGSMEPVAVLDYELPASVPSLMADKRGYSAGSEKYAILRLSPETEVPEYFYIRNMENGRIIYEGAFENSKMGDGLIKASFSDLNAEGTYRVECDTYGCSEEFAVSSMMFGELTGVYGARVLDACRDLSADPQTVLDFLQAYEWYGSEEGSAESDSIVSGAPDSLTAVRDWISGKDYQGSEGNDAVLYATILAKFSFLYKDYDSSLATECLQKASSIYSQSGNVIRSDDAVFRLLAELYRASGESSYYNEISGYRDLFVQNNTPLEDGYMYGAMTYIVTRQSIDKDMCDLLVGHILADAQDINNRRREIVNPTASGAGGDAEMIRCIRKLMCANYILRGYEYNMAMQQMFHYLSGLNVESAVFEPDTATLGVYYLICDYLSELEKDGKL